MVHVLKCGSWKKLELDHIDPKTKESHKIWSWSEERRNKELKKCQVLCYDCHNIKSSIDKHNLTVGRRKVPVKLIEEMREYRKTHGLRETARKFHKHHSNVFCILNLRPRSPTGSRQQP